MVMYSHDLIVSIPILIESISKMTVRLYKGQDNDALSMLPDIIDGIESVMADYGSITDSPAKILELNDILSTANSIIESKNFIQLADVFEYEIIAVLSEILEEAINKSKN